MSRDAGLTMVGDAHTRDKGYGCKGDYKDTWVWFDNWITRVVEHCKENADRYT